MSALHEILAFQGAAMNDQVLARARRKHAEKNYKRLKAGYRQGQSSLPGPSRSGGGGKRG